MIIKLHEIDEHRSQYDFRINKKDLLRFEDRFEFEWMDCQAVISKNQETIILSGQYQVDLKTICDFCLTPTTYEVDEEFELNLVSEQSEAPIEKDVEISLGSPNSDFYQGEEINLNTYFEEQLILDTSITIRCSDSCKGMCPTCGINRNKEDCDCSKETGNNPFAVLKDLDLD